MNENTRNQEPLSNLAYDWVTIVQHKSKALRAYQQYIQDAQQANSPECVELMQQIHEQDARHLEQATRHLVEVLRSGRMGPTQGESQTGQGEGGRTGQTSGQGGRAGTSQGERGGAGTSQAASQAGMGGMNQGEGGQGRMGQTSSQGSMSGGGRGMTEGDNPRGPMENESSERRGQRNPR